MTHSQGELAHHLCGKGPEGAARVDRVIKQVFMKMKSKYTLDAITSRVKMNPETHFFMAEDKR